MRADRRRKAAADQAQCWDNGRAAAPGGREELRESSAGGEVREESAKEQPVHPDTNMIQILYLHCKT